MQWDKAMYGTLLAVLLIISGLGFMGGLSKATPNYNNSNTINSISVQSNNILTDVNKTTSKTQESLQSQQGIIQTFSILTDTAVSGVKLMGKGAVVIYTLGSLMFTSIGLPSYFATILFIMIGVGVIGMIMTAFTGGRL